MAQQVAALQRVAEVQKLINNTTGVTGGSNTSARGADIVAYGKQLDDLRAKYNPLFDAGQKYKASLAEINQAAKVGAISEKERADAVLNAKVAFIQQVNALQGVRDANDSATKSVKGLSEAHGGLTTQAQSLFHAIRGAGEQIALGVPITQAATAQINHLTYAASGEGGLSGAFGQLKDKVGSGISAIAEAATPLRLLAGGAAVAGAAAVVMAYQWSKAQEEVEQALIGIGRRTGTTGADINKFASDNATATGLSVSQAREAAVEFTKTGQVSVSQLKGLGDAVNGFSILTGATATEAAKALAKALSGDLVNGAQELDKVYGALDGRTLQYIATLQATGDKQQAQQVILNAITE
jgi:phage-related minor tail protein